jgi:cell division ATPase FtsA
MVPLAEQVFQTPVRLGTPMNVAGVNGAAETAMSAGFAAAVGLLHYGARPRDYMPVRRDNAHLLGKVRQRLKGWMEAFF